MKARVLGLIVLNLVALFGLAYRLRPIFPSPGGYVERLYWLNGWSTKGYLGLNCSGYIANAHGSEFMEAEDFFAGGKGELETLALLDDRSAIDETKLRAGDIAAWHGHVAAFLRPGVWIDSDSRRGCVTTFRLQDKPSSDPWFVGQVRILRWKTPGSAFLLNYASVSMPWRQL